jgi:exodeoxyribonuclease V beta subunit
MLTRGMERCYLALGRVNGYELSAAAYLLHPPPGFAGGGFDADHIAALRDHVRGLTDEQMLEDLKALQARSSGSIRVMNLPVSAGRPANHHPARPEVLNCRRFEGTIDRSWRISSYSSLVSLPMQDLERPDRDAFNRQPEARRPASATEPGSSHEASIFDFPRGARAGLFFHDLFEHLDFTRADEEVTRELIAETLARHGFGARWHESVTDCVQRTLSVPLGAPPAGFMLREVPRQSRCNEMEFYFPVERLSPEDLTAVLGRNARFLPERDGNRAFPGLSFAPARGFMKGFVDLVFRHNRRWYLLDWKSNHLGDDLESYLPQRLEAVMRENHYVLQYLIYTLALDRHLKRRVPGYEYARDFGGVFYMFVRGIQPDRFSPHGVFFDKPTEEEIRELAQRLLPGHAP